MTKLLAAFVLLTLFAGPLSALGLLGGTDEYSALPTRYLRVEPLSLGGSMLGYHARLLKADCLFGGLRLGLSLWESDYAYDVHGTAMWLPVRAGLTLWSNPKRTAFFYGMVPDIYTELTASPFGGSFRFEPAAKISLGCDVDYYGLGLGIEAGWASLIVEDIGPGPTWRYNGFYASVRIRALPFGIGF